MSQIQLHENGLSYQTIDELVENRERAIASLDLQMFARHLEGKRFHFVTTTHYSTIDLMSGDLVCFNPNYNPFENNLPHFAEVERRDPNCLGLVPLTIEAKAELRRLGLKPEIKGDILTSQKEIYDAYK